MHKFISTYLNDILIYSKTYKKHMQHIELVLLKLREAGLQADINKCEFFVKETKFLGLIVSTTGIRIDLNKVKAILD